MHHQKSPVYKSLGLLAMCIVLSGLFSACSGSGDNAQVSGNTGTIPPGTGISFQIIFQKPSSGSTAHMLTPAFNSCADYAIGTISATVTTGTTTVVSNSWPCALHQGLIIAVPAGSNYTVHISALSSALPATTTWSGLVSSITVTTGQVTNAGTVVLSYVGGDTTQPTVTSSYPNSNPTATTNVPVTDRFTIAFSKAMAISTITSTNITVNNGSVQGTVNYNGANNTASFIPSAALTYNTQYVLQIASCVAGSCIKDTAGNQLATDSTNTFMTESPPSALASPPANLTTTPGNGQVRLDWLAANGATSYNVYFSTTSGVTGTQIASVNAPAVHLGLTNGTTYYYAVTSVTNSFGESTPTAQSGATPTLPAGNPPPPASLSVNFNNGTPPYTVTWPTVTGMSYNLYWSPRAIYPDHTAADNVVRYVAGGQYIHASAQAGVTYCYVLTALNAAGESADSMQVCGPGAGAIGVFWP